MPARPLYVVCVFNVYAHEPDDADETSEDRDERKRTYHYAGFTASEAEEMARFRFHRSSDHNWTLPVLIGEFPTKTDEAGREIADVDVVTCPHCGATF